MTSPATELPKNLEALHAPIQNLEVENARLRDANRELTAKALKFQDLYFGKSSEKTRPKVNADDLHQIPLFQAELLVEAKQAAEANNVSGSMSSTPGKPPRKGGRRSKFPKHVPRVETKYELKDEDRRCDCGCEEQMHFVGFETSKELGRIETTIVHTIKHSKYACRTCGKAPKAVARTRP